MGRLAEASGAKAPRALPGPKCSVGDFLDSLDDEDRSDLHDLLFVKRDVRGKRWSSTAIGDLVKEVHGKVLSEYMLGRHRSKRCGCWKLSGEVA